ncbi:hypothetical protein GCT13_45415 [Paraburkholderia sp. CNPSo 3157]|uniref:Uncharacterized protein n=1 Tax=Paraburkholderia franconis TaxID=2654983 RepID=A0A7X1NKP1_9BURK|nr:hypothetical protein [Paraburkholderia franconis]
MSYACPITTRLAPAHARSQLPDRGAHRIDLCMEHATCVFRERSQNVGKGGRRAVEALEQTGVRAWMKVAHRLLLRGSKEENGLARSSSPAMLRGKQIETRSVQPVDHGAHCLSWI